MKMQKLVILWLPFALVLGCSRGTETATNEGATATGNPSQPTNSLKSQPCTTPTPLELYVATNEQTSQQAKYKAFEKLWPNEKAQQDKTKELLTSVSTAKAEVSKVESELTDFRDRFQTMSSSGGSDTQKLNELDRLEKHISNLSKKRDRLKAVETRAARAYSVGVSTSRTFSILNRNLDVYVVAPHQQKPGKWRFLTQLEPAGRAIARILTNEFSWKAKGTGSPTYQKGFTIRLIEEPSPNAIGIQLAAGGNEANILKDDFFKPVEVETSSGKISAKIKVHLEFSASHFEGYAACAENLSPKDEQKWIAQNKFSFVKYSLVHEVAHALGMIHELQRQEKSDELNSWKDLSESCKQLFQFKIEGDFYNDQIYAEEDLCSSYVPIAGTASGNVCRASNLDLTSIMMYWLPKCVFKQWTCNKASGCTTKTGTKTTGFFFGPDEDNPPLKGYWLADDDRAFFEQYK